MPPDRTCPDCGHLLPPDAPEGLCPACLMGAGLDQTGGDDAPGASADLPPTRADAVHDAPTIDRLAVHDEPTIGPEPAARPPAARRHHPLLRRLRAARRGRPRRHGRRLQGPAGHAQPHRRPQDDPRRPARLARPTSAASAPRPRPPPASTTPASSPSTRSASTRASTTSAWASSRATSLADEAGRRAAGAPQAARAGRGRWPRPSSTPTSAA